MLLSTPFPTHVPPPSMPSSFFMPSRTVAPQHTHGQQQRNVRSPHYMSEVARPNSLLCPSKEVPTTNSSKESPAPDGGPYSFGTTQIPPHVLNPFVNSNSVPGKNYGRNNNGRQQHQQQTPGYRTPPQTKQLSPRPQMNHVATTVQPSKPLAVPNPLVRSAQSPLMSAPPSLQPPPIAGDNIAGVHNSTSCECPECSQGSNSSSCSTSSNHSNPTQQPPDLGANGTPMIPAVPPHIYGPLPGQHIPMPTPRTRNGYHWVPHMVPYYHFLPDPKRGQHLSYYPSQGHRFIPPMPYPYAYRPVVPYQLQRYNNNNKKTTKSCYNCGNQGHLSNECTEPTIEEESHIGRFCFTYSRG